jgi:hypothetical protein
MEVSGQLHAPAALPPEKEPPVPIGYSTEIKYGNKSLKNMLLLLR